MALQGNLRDFAASEILQLVGTQKKSGCLTLEWNTEKAVVWILEGRIISTRLPGMTKDDPLLAFLRRVHRLSDEQYRGLQTIQKESGRDLEDLLLNGRYLDAQELALYVERQMLDDLTRIVRWESGSYRFDPNAKWPHAPVATLSMEGAMIEAARRVDEQKRFVGIFKDPYQLLGLRDLPDPDEPLNEEEREIFGIIDGLHTVAEVVEATPMSEYEAYEALQRMLDAEWIEFVGRRDPGVVAPAAPVPANAPPAGPKLSWARELAVTAVILALVFAVRLTSSFVPSTTQPDPAHDVYAAAHVRDLRFALDLYHRERGDYPRTLGELVEDRWIASDQVQVAGYRIRYRPGADGQDYALELLTER